MVKEKQIKMKLIMVEKSRQRGINQKGKLERVAIDDEFEEEEERNLKRKRKPRRGKEKQMKMERKRRKEEEKQKGKKKIAYEEEHCQTTSSQYRLHTHMLSLL